MVLRKHFDISTASYTADKQHVFQNIIGNEDVLYYWDVLSINWDTNEARELLYIIVEHYTTICGFSFAKVFMEKYKQSMKKTTQKSKGLRKTLDSSKVCITECLKHS